MLQLSFCYKKGYFNMKQTKQKGTLLLTSEDALA